MMLIAYQSAAGNTQEELKNWNISTGFNKIITFIKIRIVRVFLVHADRQTDR
jgi:hypothetical protein